jgi:hypothetical protein
VLISASPRNPFSFLFTHPVCIIINIDESQREFEGRKRAPNELHALSASHSIEMQRKRQAATTVIEEERIT